MMTTILMINVTSTTSTEEHRLGAREPKRFRVPYTKRGRVVGMV